MTVKLYMVSPTGEQDPVRIPEEVDIPKEELREEFNKQGLLLWEVFTNKTK